MLQLGLPVKEKLNSDYTDQISTDYDFEQQGILEQNIRETLEYIHSRLEEQYLPT